MIAVVVTYDRPALLARCLAAVEGQTHRPDSVIVVDDASPDAGTAAALSGFPDIFHVRHTTNRGGAAAYCTGIETALAQGADLVWLMDDDGLPAQADCLGRLVASLRPGAGIAAPLVLDDEDPARLAFPIRIGFTTWFTRAEVAAHRHIEGFAHFFNGALVRASVFRAIGLPDPRFQARGDEVEFLLRARRAGVLVRIDTAAIFLHPGSRPEIHPVLFGAFHAAVPTTEGKRRAQFRNRGYIFRRYGMWGYLVADLLRYAWHYLLRRHPDPRGFGRWLAATARGWGGGFMRVPALPRDRELVRGPRLPAHAAEGARDIGLG